MKNVNWIKVDTKQPDDFQRNILNAFRNSEACDLGAHKGDIHICLDDGKLIAIEYKVVPGDFIASIFDHRLFNQAEGIRKLTPWSFLLLSNEFKYNSNDEVMGIGPNGYGSLGWSKNSIEGAKRAVQARGLIIDTAYDGYIEAIRRIITWVSDADNGSITREVIKLSPFDEHDQLTVNMLSWFKDIGVGKAKSFIDWCNRNGKLPRYKILELALTQFEGNDKPSGWTSHTIEKNREQLEYPKPERNRGEWVEEIDQE